MDMRFAVLIALGIVLAITASPAAPARAALYLVQLDRAQEDGEPRGDRFEDRWQGRQHWLYDETNPAPATDGSGANAKARCVNVLVRVKRPDGSTIPRWQRRCD